MATSAAFAGGRRAEGLDVSAGVTRAWRVGRGLSVSTGAGATYARLTFQEDPDEAATLSALDAAPSLQLEVPSQRAIETLALEVPVGLVVDVAEAGPGRIRAGGGVVASLYLAQAFDVEGRLYSRAPGSDVSVEGAGVTAVPFSSSATVEPLRRLDLARQATLSLGYTLDRGRVPLGLEATVRLPLGGVTSQDLSLTTVGLRLRVGL